MVGGGEPFTAFDIEFSYHAIMDGSGSDSRAEVGLDTVKWVKRTTRTDRLFHKEKLATNIWAMNHSIIRSTSTSAA